MKVLGKGSLWDVTNGLEFYEQSTVTLTFDQEVLTVQGGDTWSDKDIPIRAQVQGNLGFRDMNSKVLTFLTGASAADGSVKAVKRAQITIANSLATLSQTLWDVNSIRVIDSDGVHFLRTPSAPGLHQFIATAAGSILTFSSAENGTVIEVTYMYADGADGRTVTIQQTDIAQAFNLVGYLDAYDTDRGSAIEGGVAFKCFNCVRTGGFDIGAANAEVSEFAFDFKVNGNTVFYFNGDINQA